MRYKDNKKDVVKQYILEKIAEGESDISLKVADNFSINRNTVYTYINELTEEGQIRRVKRGQYELLSEKHSFTLDREAGELESDMYVYAKYFSEFFKAYPDNVRRIWEYVLSEMINNVIDHSEGRYLSAIIQKNTFDTSVILADNGIGIFEKILKSFKLLTIEDVKCELFKGKLTTNPECHSGEGIFFSSRVMDDFIIYSDGVTFSVNSFDEEILTGISLDVKGTGIYMRICNASEKNIADIFHQYENEDAEFKNTTILLKNVFASGPISRSQAKRLYNRLDKFEKVTLDFEGIDWMGQGFSHELFNIFAAAHPEIELITVNVSEDVDRMIKHCKRGN